MSSSNLPPAFRRAKQDLRFARVDEGRDHQAQEMSLDDEQKQENLSKIQKRNRNSCDLDKRSRPKKALVTRGIMSDLSLHNISDIASFLNLKEKALVRSLNKTWMKGSTLGTKVEVNPEIGGRNLDGPLKFVASSFPNLKDFELNYDYDYQKEQWGKLSGDSLSRLFDQESICLDSVSLHFGFGKYDTSRILVDEEGFSTLHRQVSLRKLKLKQPYFATIDSLISVIRPLVNLQCLRLSWLEFPNSEYENNDTYSLWRNGSNLMEAIGSLPNLQSLEMDCHCITDQDLRHLSPLRDLRKLDIEANFFGRRDIETSLTDASMTFIASSFPKLKSLNVNLNRAITVAGLRKVIHSCPLIALEADELIGEEHLESIVKSKPSLRFVRYGRGLMPHMPTNNNLLKKATIASQGLCLFTGDEGIYEPKFDPTLLANHDATKKFMTGMDSTMYFLRPIFEEVY